MRNRGGDRIYSVHHIDPKRLFPSFRCVSDSQGADVTYDRINPAKLRGSTIDPLLKCLRISNVDRPSPTLDTPGCKRFDGFGNLIGISCADCDIRTFSGKKLRDCETDAFATARHQYILTS